MLYTYPSFIGNFSGLTDYPLWIARYSNQVPADASGWKRWDFWQYSDGAVGGTLPNGGRKVPGIVGNVDLNEFDGSIDQLRAQYGKKQQPVKDEYTMLNEEIKELKDTVKQQAEWIKKQKELSEMPCPDWAKPAYEYYKLFITDDKGSYDFWRQLVINYRKEKGITVK
jgi:hypothetical protein